MSSYADQATATLQSCAEATYRTCYLAGSHLARARSEAAKASDLVEVLARVIDMLVAVEALHDAADAACKSLRATLSSVMADNGATTIRATHHVATVARKPAFLSIENEAAVPAEYWIQPPKAIDRAQLKSAVKDGAVIEGVNLVIPNDMQLRITATKERSS